MTSQGDKFSFEIRPEEAKSDQAIQKIPDRPVVPIADDGKKNKFKETLSKKFEDAEAKAKGVLDDSGEETAVAGLSPFDLIKSTKDAPAKDVKIVAMPVADVTDELPEVDLSGHELPVVEVGKQKLNPTPPGFLAAFAQVHTETTTSVDMVTSVPAGRVISVPIGTVTSVPVDTTTSVPAGTVTSAPVDTTTFARGDTVTPTRGDTVIPAPVNTPTSDTVTFAPVDTKEKIEIAGKGVVARGEGIVATGANVVTTGKGVVVTTGKGEIVTKGPEKKSVEARKIDVTADPALAVAQPVMQPVAAGVPQVDPALKSEMLHLATKARVVTAQIVEQMISKLTQVITTERVDTTVLLKYPPLFEGVTLVVTQVPSAPKELNITFLNLVNPEARALIEMKANQIELREHLIASGYMLHTVTIEPKIVGLGATTSDEANLRQRFQGGNTGGSLDQETAMNDQPS